MQSHYKQCPSEEKLNLKSRLWKKVGPGWGGEGSSELPQVVINNQFVIVVWKDFWVQQANLQGSQVC